MTIATPALRRLTALGDPPPDLCFADVETSGLDENEHEIIEIAAVRVDPITFVLKDEMEALVLPTKPVPPAAAAINGYNPEEWAAEGISLHDALVRLFPVLEGASLAGQNPDFDKRFITASARREQLVMPKLGSYRMPDVSSLAYPLLMIGLVPATGLETTTSFFCVPGVKHRAKSDVLRALSVFQILTEVYAVAAERAFAPLERRWCAHCKKIPVAYESAIYCGAGCAARAEVRS